MEIKLRLQGFNNAVAASKRNPRELKRLQKKGLSRIAQIGINIIQERTEDGIGYKDGAFKPYSGDLGSGTGYIAFRQRRGATTKPNLFLTGKMLGSMTSKVKSHRSAEIFFARASESKKAAFNNQTRPFFGFSRDEEKKLLKHFERFIK